MGMAVYRNRSVCRASREEERHVRVHRAECRPERSIGVGRNRNAAVSADRFDHGLIDLLFARQAVRPVHRVFVGVVTQNRFPRESGESGFVPSSRSTISGTPSPSESL